MISACATMAHPRKSCNTRRRITTIATSAGAPHIGAKSVGALRTRTTTTVSTKTAARYSILAAPITAASHIAALGQKTGIARIDRAILAPYTDIPFASTTKGIAMLTPATLALFSGACLALTVTPGPDMLLIASRSASQGRIAGFASLAGIQAGTYCHAMAAAFGLSQLFLAVPLAYDALRFAGAAYLLYLAWKTLRSKPQAAAPRNIPHTLSPGRIFTQGLLTNILNPKMALFVLALFPQFVRLQDGNVAGQILILATVLNLIGLCVNGAVILCASHVARRLGTRHQPSRWPQYLLGSVFAGLALRLACANRN